MATTTASTSLPHWDMTTIYPGLESPEFATEDKSEVATEVTFVGCFSGVGAAEPWKVYVPPPTSS